MKTEIKQCYYQDEYGDSMYAESYAESGCQIKKYCIPETCENKTNEPLIEWQDPITGYTIGLTVDDYQYLLHDISSIAVDDNNTYEYTISVYCDNRKTRYGRVQVGAYRNLMKILWTAESASYGKTGVGTIDIKGVLGKT